MRDDYPIHYLDKYCDPQYFVKQIDCFFIFWKFNIFIFFELYSTENIMNILE